MVVGDGPTGAALIESAIDKVIVTGSVATGRRVAEVAANRSAPGGAGVGRQRSHDVLPEVANLDVASSGAMWGAFMNAGQTCLSVERCYVHRSIYEPFLELCKRRSTSCASATDWIPKSRWAR